MLHTTFAKALKYNACRESYRKMGKALGGITQYGKDTPIPLDKVLAVCGLHNAIWSLRCTVEPSENILIEFACLCAEHVLHIYEDKHPDDKRPRKAIEAVRVCITDKAAADAARAAADAAWDAGAAAGAAARAAAWDAGAAAWAAAWDAGAAARAAARAAEDAAVDAGAAEQGWQAKKLLELLSKPRSDKGIPRLRKPKIEPVETPNEQPPVTLSSEQPPFPSDAKLPDISTFSFVPPELGVSKLFTLKLRGKGGMPEFAVGSKTLSEGVKDLLKFAGIDQKYAENAPPSEGKDLLLSILEKGDKQ